MPRHGKKYRQLKEKIDRAKLYPVSEAFELLSELKAADFDESVDVAFNLGVDPRKADQMVRGTTVLPHGTGKSIRVLVFAKGEKEKEAQEAGADYVGADDLIEKIKGGWLEFDRAIATPDIMKDVSRLGKVLGPRGLMPNPKSGTVTFDLAKAIQEVKAGKAEFRVEKAGIVHCNIGKHGFGGEKLKENFQALASALLQAKPETAKGTYIKSVAISTTMGPGIKIDPLSLRS